MVAVFAASQSCTTSVLWALALRIGQEALMLLRPSRLGVNFFLRALNALGFAPHNKGLVGRR
eukprot:12636104-Alexandrium_andersonii.AAC.1